MRQYVLVTCLIVGSVLALAAGGTGPLWLAAPGLGLSVTGLVLLMKYERTRE